MYVLAAYLSEGKAQLIHIDLWEKGNLVKKVFGYTAEHNHLGFNEMCY